MKRIAAIVFALIMSASLVYAEPLTDEPETQEVAAESVTESVTEAATEPSDGVMSASSETEDDQIDTTFTSEVMPLYVTNMEDPGQMPVYFINGVRDLPYINLSDWTLLLNDLFYGEQVPYHLTYETDGSLVMLTRENGFSMMVDFENKKILFDDYDAFIYIKGGTSLLDSISDLYTDVNSQSGLIEKIQQGSFDRYGKEIELDLDAYDISLYWSEQDSVYLVPLQTLSDFMIAYPSGRAMLYNTAGLYLGNVSEFGFNADELTEMGDSYYYSVPSNMLSDELSWYSYCELCMALDNLYGLKEIHDISSFDKIFRETGYFEPLTSNDPNIRDGALIDFINYYLDDLHSGFKAASYLTEEADTAGEEGLSFQKDTNVGKLYSDARSSADHVIESYEEVGNTAYITFDNFSMRAKAEDYYAGNVDVDMDPESGTLDTAALIIYAHKQITRKDSPIENVVIDLSLNGGGDIDAAAFVAAWFLGEASISVRSSMTGATSTGTYRADINLDGKCDKNDTVSDKNLYCLTSPYSFSCGNLLPNMFRSSGNVTLLGKETGGGSCSILTLATAYGSMFNISSPRRLSYMKNGSFYDTDTGIRPDCIIVKPENFYNRQPPTEYIKQLF